jgi:RHS repeat-associated protein
MTPSLGSAVTTAYDNFSRATSVATAGVHTLSFAYDQLSRNISATRVAGGATQVLGYQYDLAGRRTRVTWPDGFYALYDVDVTGAVTAIRENGAASGVGVLASYAYDDYGRRTSVARGNGVATAYAYDGASLLSALTQDLAASASDQSLAFTYNASGQALTRTASNAAYVWQQPALGAANTVPNGRNQIASLNGASFTYDARGNLTATGAASYGYDVFNRLTSAGAATLSYDPAGRLYETMGGGVTTRFLYDGLDAIAEYNGSNVMQRRFVHGPGVDEPVVWYEGAGTSDRRWLVQDQLGSVIAVTNSAGAALSTNTYDEYGIPGASNSGRFQYTGQMWLGEANLYHYKARAYAPALGRFLQSDPILYAGGINLYAYVGNDPVNARDPLGLQHADPEETPGTNPNGHDLDDIVVTAEDWERAWRLAMDANTASHLDALFAWLDAHADAFLAAHPELFEERGLENDFVGLDGKHYQLCPLIQGEVSSGIQVGAQARFGPFNLNSVFDVWSVRAGARTTNQSSAMVWSLDQTTGLAGEIGVAGLVTRGGWAGWSAPAAGGSVGSHFQTRGRVERARGFLGIGGGVAMGFGISGRMGFLLIPVGASCP